MNISIACLGFIKLQSQFEKQLNLFCSFESREVQMNIWCEVLELLASLDISKDIEDEEKFKSFSSQDIAFCTDIRCSEFFSNLSLEEEKFIYKTFRDILSV